MLAMNRLTHTQMLPGPDSFARVVQGKVPEPKHTPDAKGLRTVSGLYGMNILHRLFLSVPLILKGHQKKTHTWRGPEKKDTPT